MKNLTSFKFEPATPNMSQKGDQTRSACCAPHNVTIGWVEMLQSFSVRGLRQNLVILRCCFAEDSKELCTSTASVFSSLNLLFGDRSRWRCCRVFPYSAWRAWRWLSHRRFNISLFTHAEHWKRAMRARSTWGLRFAFRFALASSSLATLSALSTIE